MMIRERDELLIQRCVDDELTSAETRALLQRLDQLESGWKLLACGLLEDRRIQRALGTPDTKRDREESIEAERSASATPVVKQSRARAAAQHWWSHPVTSLTLCAAIAFVGGMLIPDLQPNGTSSIVKSDIAAAPPAAALGQSAENGSYRLQMQPGGMSFDIPVYSNFDELRRNERNHPLFSTEADRKNSVEWMFVPVDGNKSMMIPVSRDSVFDIQ